MSLISYLNILTSSIKFSETVTMSIKQISNSHVLASIIYQDRCPIVQVGDHTFFLIRTSHNFIHHKSMKHLKDCTLTINIVHILNSVYHRFSKHVFPSKNIPFSCHRQMRQLHLEVSWERGSPVPWASIIRESTLVVATSSHKNTMSRVSVGNPFQLEFPVSS